MKIRFFVYLCCGEILVSLETNKSSGKYNTGVLLEFE